MHMNKSSANIPQVNHLLLLDVKNQQEIERGESFLFHVPNRQEA